MRYFEDITDFLALFEVNEQSPGVVDFGSLVVLVSCTRAFGAADEITLGRLATRMMRDAKLSPMIFWSRMRRALRPVLEAGRDTLVELGIDGSFLPEGRAPTCPELIQAVASCVEYSGVTDDDFDELRRMFLEKHGNPEATD